MSLRQLRLLDGKPTRLISLAQRTPNSHQIPAGVSWPALDAALRAAGVVVGGSYGPYQGKLFRIGHMGEQARPELVAGALAVIERVLLDLGHTV